MSQFVANGLIASAVYLLVGIAFYFTFVFCHRFDVSIAAFIALGPYVTYLCQPHVGLCAGAAMALVTCMGIGGLLQVVVYARLLQRSPSGLTGMVASFGIYIVFQNLLSCAFGDVRVSFRTWPVQEGLLVLGAYWTTAQIVIGAAALSYLLCVGAGLRFTSLGREARAIAGDSERARAFGVRVDRVRVYATGLGALLASGAGILIASDVDMTPGMGMQPFLMGVIAGIIGRGRLRGVAAGALVVGLSQHIAMIWVPTAWQNGIAFAILLLFLLAAKSHWIGSERGQYG